MKKLKFGNKKFDAIICLNANLPDRLFFTPFMQIPIIAADGAAKSLLGMNIIPEFIIGDMDSLDLSLIPKDFNSTHIKIIEDQDTTDFEKILDFSKNNNYINLLITGIHGGELEHTLNNISVYKRYNKSLNLCIFDFNRYGILIDTSVSIDTNIDEMISLIPSPSVNISTTNLKWALINEELSLGTREGARNKTVNDFIKLEIHSGEVFVFLNPRIPFAPEFI